MCLCCVSIAQEQNISCGSWMELLELCFLVKTVTASKEQLGLESTTQSCEEYDC